MGSEGPIFSNAGIMLAYFAFSRVLFKLLIPCAWFLCFSILIAELRIQARNLTIKSLVLVDTFNQTVDAVSAVPQLWRMGLSGF